MVLCRIDRDDREPIVNLDGVIQSLFLCRIDRDDGEPIINLDGVVVESLFFSLCAGSTMMAHMANCEPRWDRRVIVFFCNGSTVMADCEH